MVQWTLEKDQLVSIAEQCNSYRQLIHCSSSRVRSTTTRSPCRRSSSNILLTRSAKVGPLVNDRVLMLTLSGCSRKAVSMHLQKYFSNVSKKSTGSSKSTPAKATPRKQISTPKATPRSRVKLTSASKSFLRKKAADSDSDPDDDDDDDDDEASPSPLVNRKRARSSEKVKSYMESDADSGDSEDYSPKKRVKQEPVDDDADCVFDSVFGRQDKYDAFA
jgi:hypothetical protein